MWKRLPFLFQSGIGYSRCCSIGLYSVYQAQGQQQSQDASQLQSPHQRQVQFTTQKTQLDQKQALDQNQTLDQTLDQNQTYKQEQKQVQDLKNKHNLNDLYLYFALDFTSSSNEYHWSYLDSLNPYRAVLSVLHEVTTSPFEAFYFGGTHDLVYPICDRNQCKDFPMFLQNYEKVRSYVGGGWSCLCSSLYFVNRQAGLQTPSSPQTAGSKVLIIVTDGELHCSRQLNAFLQLPHKTAVFTILIDSDGRQSMMDLAKAEPRFGFVDYTMIQNRSDKEKKKISDGKKLAQEFIKFLDAKKGFLKK